MSELIKDLMAFICVMAVLFVMAIVATAIGTGDGQFSQNFQTQMMAAILFYAIRIMNNTKQVSP